MRSNGEIKWRGRLVYINCALAGEPVGLAETAAGWTVSFGPIALGVIAHGGVRLRNPNRPAVDFVDNTARRNRVHSLRSSTRAERNENCVTHVVGQICYLSSRFAQPELQK